MEASAVRKVRDDTSVGLFIFPSSLRTEQRGFRGWKLEFPLLEQNCCHALRRGHQAWCSPCPIGESYRVKWCYPKEYHCSPGGLLSLRLVFGGSAQVAEAQTWLPVLREAGRCYWMWGILISDGELHLLWIQSGKLASHPGPFLMSVVVRHTLRVFGTAGRHIRTVGCSRPSAMGPYVQHCLWYLARAGTFASLPAALWVVESWPGLLEAGETWLQWGCPLQILVGMTAKLQAFYRHQRSHLCT